LSDNCRIGTEAPLPEPVPEDRGAVPPNRFLVLRERPAERRLHPERGEESRRDLEALYTFRLVASDKIHVPPVECGQIIDGVDLALPVEKVRG
jgi:hypothetical protein